MVVFDTSIPIQLAFYALLEHGAGRRAREARASIEHRKLTTVHRARCGTDMQAAPLWDSCRRKFVGLMTVVDFIDILRHYHQRSISMEELASQSISHVLGDPQEGKRMQHLSFVSVDINSTLYNACNTLHTCALRFLPVISPDSGGGVLAVISHLDVLNFLVSQFREQRRLFEHSILDLRIGTFDNLITVPHNSLLRNVLHVLDFIERTDGKRFYLVMELCLGGSVLEATRVLPSSRHAEGSRSSAAAAARKCRRDGDPIFP